jgi:hypothetical protein
MVKTLVLALKHLWLITTGLPQNKVSEVRAPLFAGVFEDGSEQKGHK